MVKDRRIIENNHHHQLKSENMTEIEQVKGLYDDCRLKECISYVDEKDQNLCFPHHQTMQMYKALCFFESQQLTQAFKCFDDIIEESKQQKAGRVEEVDVLIRVMYQLQLKYYCTQLAEQQNHFLLKVTEEYQEQNSLSYQQDVFLFGMGTYLFIESGRGEINPLAQKNLFAALELSEKYKQEITQMIGNTYYFSDQVDKALEWYQKLYTLNPHYPSATNNYAACARQLNIGQKAEQLYLEEVKLREFSPLILSNMANYYQSIWDIKQKKIYIDKLSKLEPNNSFALSKYGYYQSESGNISEGIQNLKRSITLEPKLLLPYNYLIKLLSDNNEFEEAIKYIRICIELYPQDGYFHNQLAKVLMSQNELEQAEFHSKRSIELKNHPQQKQQSFILLGNIYEQQHEYTKALQLYLNATKQEAKNSDNFIFDITCKMSNMINNHYYISLKEVIQEINHHEGICFAKIIESSFFFPFNPEIQDLCYYKLAIFQVSLMIQSYKKHVQEFLTFKSQTQFWDLYLD